MEIACPTCRSKIATADINVSTDVALCRACGNTFRLSEIVGIVPAAAVDLNSPPAGAWYEPLPDGFSAGATTRSWAALFLVPFTCVWAGGSMAGIYGTQIYTGHFKLFPSLFGIPFLIGSIILVSVCAMNVAGKVTITRHADRLTIFTGVGPIGWTRSSAWSDFRTAREDFTAVMNNYNRQGKVIRLEGNRAIAFGSILTTDRRYFLLSAIQSDLAGSSPSPIFAATQSRFR
jgi:hypothetical protein